MPTPVTNSAIVIDSGSTRKPTSTLKPPAGIHSNSVDDVVRACSSGSVEQAEEHDDARRRTSRRT